MDVEVVAVRKWALPEGEVAGKWDLQEGVGAAVRKWDLSELQ